MSRSLNRPHADKPTEPALPVVVESIADVELPDDDLQFVEPPPTLPEGVQMHEAGVMPSQALPAELEQAPDPKAPPKGWKGGYARCGGCGDFLGEAKSCAKCAPAALPSNIAMSSLPVAVSR